MKSWGRYRSDQADHQVLRLEEERSGAVLPDGLQRELEPAIGTLLQTVLGQRRARDVTAEPLELQFVTSIHALPRVQVDAAHFRDGVGVVASGKTELRRRST